MRCAVTQGLLVSNQRLELCSKIAEISLLQFVLQPALLVGLIAVLTGAAPALRPLPPQLADTSATRTQRITNSCRISATAATADAGEKAINSILSCPCCGKTMEFAQAPASLCPVPMLWVELF